MLHDLAQLLKAIAWPGVFLTALILLLPQIREAVRALAEKIRSATRVKIGGKAGLELATEIARNRAKMKNSAQPREEEDLRKRFEELTIQYDNMPRQNAKDHVDKRMEIADELGELVVNLKMDRAGLAESASEAKLVGFATAVVNAPMANDLKNLCAASAKAKFRFTRYRIVLALLPTLSRPDVSSRMLASCNTVLDNVERHGAPTPDESLQKIIDKTRRVLEDIQSTLV